MTLACIQCGHEWNETDIEGRKTMRAAAVNGNGPFCLLCMYVEMADRIAQNRKHPLAADISKINAGLKLASGPTDATVDATHKVPKGF
jgi:hypothetical protein